jgi:hypothetical protein
MHEAAHIAGRERLRGAFGVLGREADGLQLRSGREFGSRGSWFQLGHLYKKQAGAIRALRYASWEIQIADAIGEIEQIAERFW